MQSILERLRAKVSDDQDLRESIRKMVDPILDHTRVLDLRMEDGDKSPAIRNLGSRWGGIDTHYYAITFGADWLLDYLFTPKKESDHGSNEV